MDLGLWLRGHSGQCPHVSPNVGLARAELGALGHRVEPRREFSGTKSQALLGKSDGHHARRRGLLRTRDLEPVRRDGPVHAGGQGEDLLQRRHVVGQPCPNDLAGGVDVGSEGRQGRGSS